MNEIVRHKRPAAVLYGPVVAPLGERAVVYGRTRDEMLESVRRRTRRGEIATADGSSIRIEDGHWMITVRLVAATEAELLPRPRWIRPARWVAGVGTAAGLLYWLLSSLSAASLFAVMLGVALGLVLLVRHAVRGGRGSIVVEQGQRVTIR